MARVHNNIFVRGLSGKLAGQFVLRTLRDGRTVVCKIPDFSNRKLSKEQKNHHTRFKEASAYAKDASRTNPIYAELAEGTMKNAYNVALGDWFHPPVIHAVERRVQRRSKVIRVQATDDVMVAGVQVMILGEDGKVVEKGEGVRGKGPSTGSGWWEYALVAEGKVIVEARDLAGNVVRAETGD
jgi:hypothetical protein